MNKIKSIIVIFLIWRIFLLLPLYAGREILPYRTGYDYTNLWKFVKVYSPVNYFFIYPWANFDGVHYLSIAGNGYERNGRFLPLYPLLIRGFSYLLGGGPVFGAIQFFTALFIANFSLLLGLIILYKLISFDFSSKMGIFSVIFLLAFPTSFYLGSIYAESLFLLLSLLSFYYARKRQWIKASIFGMLLSITRVVGIGILPALLYEFFVQEKVLVFIREKKYKHVLKLFAKIIPLFFILLGPLSYIWFNLVNWNDAFYFLKSHGELGNGRSVNSIVLFPQTIFRYIAILRSLPLIQYEWWIALFELLTFVIVAILLFFSWKKHIRPSYLLFAVFCFIIPSLSGTFSGIPRYSLVLFPVFITLSLVKNRKIQIAYVFVSLILLFILLMFFSRGYFIA